MERISTGIKDLDRLIENAYPCNHTILITGTTGSGKAILGADIDYMLKKHFL